MAYKLDRAPYGFFLNVIGSLPAEEQREYWQIQDRKHHSVKEKLRLADLVDKAHRIWERLRTMTEDEKAHYDGYIAWRRLTHNGSRTREQMSSADQAEYDSYRFQKDDGVDPVEAKRLYEEVTERSPLSSDA